MSSPDKVESAYRQVYKISNKDDVYQIIFIDDSVVLLRGKDSQRGREIFHRLETRHTFEVQRDSGWFKLQPDSDMDLITGETEDWSEVDHIGESTKENLHDGGFKGVTDVQMADDEELLKISGLGNAGLENLREFAQ